MDSCTDDGSSQARLRRQRERYLFSAWLFTYLAGGAVAIKFGMPMSIRITSGLIFAAAYAASMPSKAM